MIKSQIPTFVASILNRLKDAGHQAYIVGGAVRDACLKRTITDWDVATSATPDEIKAIFHRSRLFALRHGTVTLVESGRNFEVTAFRGETPSLIHDLGCRDFTINAMGYDPESEEIIDPYGARRDIERKLVRAVRDPGARFREDPIRLLRAVRLTTELGFRIESGTLQTINPMAPLLNSVAPERVREETMKILLVSKPSSGFHLLVRTGLLKEFLPELLEGYLKRQNEYHRYTIFRHVMETIDQVEATPLLRLTALLHDIAKPRVRRKAEGAWRFIGHERAGAGMAEEILGRLRFSKGTIKNVTNLIRNHMIGYNSSWTDAAVRRLIRRVGPDATMELLSFRRADILAHGVENDKPNLLEELESRINEQIKNRVVTGTEALAIDGHAVMETLGIPPGPEVGKILRLFMEKVTDHPELNNQEGLMGLLEQMKNPMTHPEDPLPPGYHRPG